jgi:hypothetical protein
MVTSQYSPAFRNSERTSHVNELYFRSNGILFVVDRSGNDMDCCFNIRKVIPVNRIAG